MGIIFGLPKNMDGTEGRSAQSVKDKAENGGVDLDIGGFCSPLGMVQVGYRHIDLKSYTRKKDISPTSLLVRIQIHPMN